MLKRMALLCVLSVVLTSVAFANGNDLGNVFVKGTLGALFTDDQIKEPEFRGTFNPSIHIRALKECIWLTAFSFQDINNADAKVNLENYSAGFVVFAHDPNAWIATKKLNIYMMMEGGVAHQNPAPLIEPTTDLWHGSANGGLGVLYPTPLGNLVSEVKAFYLPTGWQMSVNLGFVKGW
jgi:hypothetical protein